MTLTADVDTPLGPARLHLDVPAGPPRGRLVLGHGAGGGVSAPDLLAVAAAATDAGWLAVRLEQPWRVAGRRVAPAPARLDVGWTAALDALPAVLATALPVPPSVLPGPVLPGPAGGWGAGPLVVGGRSAGARVACRTAASTGAAGVVCLAFPLHPPGRPERSRLGELAGAAAALPVLAVQGRRDAFGTADELLAVAPPGVQVVAVPGDHGLAAGAGGAASAVACWLAAFPA